MPPPPNSDVGYTARIDLVADGVAISFLVGMIAACGAALLPARRVSRSEIAEALRHNI
jgi:putative ABC transport system permease protein